MGISKLTTPQAWTYDWLPGTALANLFNLYPSKGDVTIATATNLPSLLDGPITVARYGALTVNAALSVTNRCRGLVILCDSLTMGAAGSISMTARGAVGSLKWAIQDILIPTNMRLVGKGTSHREFAAWLAANGYAIFDPTLYACPMPGMGDVQANWTEWPGSGGTLLSAAGCGTGGARVRGGGSNSGSNGNNGAAGVNAPGGGGGGGRYSGGGGYTADGGQGGPAVPWSGGSPGLGSYEGFGTDGYLWGGPWIQSIRPGGVCFVFCRGNVTLTSGHLFSANGESASSTYMAGAGGGRIGLVYKGTLAGTFNGTASGGGFTSWASNGGAGVADIKTFAQMGWN